MIFLVPLEVEENLGHEMISTVSQFILNSRPVCHLRSFSHIPGVRTHTEGQGKEKRGRLVPVRGCTWGHPSVLAAGGVASGSPAPKPACGADLTYCIKGPSL